MGEEIQKMFSAIAPRYDLLNHLLSLQIDKRWRKQGIAKLAGRNRVLDLCAGTLDLSIQLAKTNPQAFIDAVDFSQEMLDHGATKLSGNLPGRIRTQCADVQKLPFADASFDAAMVAYGMRNVDDNEKALKEVLRVLKPGGRFIVLEFFKPDRFMAKAFHATYGRFVMPLLGGLVSGNRQAYKYLSESIQRYYLIDDYKQLMQDCGFRKVAYHHQMGGASTLIWGDKL